MHKSSLCLLALAVLLVAGLDAAGSAKMAKSPRNRQLTMKKAAAASGKSKYHFKAVGRIELNDV